MNIRPHFFDPNRPEDDFKIHIDYNGQWFHENAPINRNKLSKLFSTALYYDDLKNEYWLITPHEQGRIKVDDVPFMVIDFEWDDTLVLKTNFDDLIIPGPDRFIYCQDHNQLCYINTHKNIPARLNRNVREQLIQIAFDQKGYDPAKNHLILSANNHDHIIARA